MSAMTSNTKMHSRAKAAAVRAEDFGTAGWLIPPVLVPALLAIMIGMRAVSLAYPW
jgi:hypothetical protein